MSRLLNKQNKGFSLIELMIVVAIIGVLSAIAIPQFKVYTCKAKTSEAQTALGSIRKMQEAYHSENGYYAGTLNEVGWSGVKGENQRYIYDITDNSTTEFSARAREDGGATFGDTLTDQWQIDQNGTLVHATNTCQG